MARRSSKTLSIDAAIHSMRGEKIILDADLARIYGVTTKRLNEQVKRKRPSLSRGLRISPEQSGVGTPNGTNCEIRHYGQPVANCDRFPEAP